MLSNILTLMDYYKTFQSSFLKETDILDLVKDREHFDKEMCLRFAENYKKHEEKQKKLNKELKEHNFGEL
mgnify:FL=1